jgi:ABC-type amino acid transport substrate-binding protein
MTTEALIRMRPVVNGALPPDIAAIQKVGVLRVAVFQGNMPPFSMRNAAGEWQGIEIDLMQMAAKEMGVQLMLKPMATYDDIVNAVITKQADAGIGLSLLPGRELKISFTNGYISFHPHLLVSRLQASEKSFDNAAQIIQWLQTGAPVKIGVLAQSSARQLVQLAFPKAEIISYPSTHDAFTDVLHGKIFAAVAMTPIEVKNFLQEQYQGGLLGLDVPIPTITNIDSIAVPWDYFHLRLWFNTYLNYLQLNGTLAQIFEKYGYVP